MTRKRALPAEEVPKRDRQIVEAMGGPNRGVQARLAREYGLSSAAIQHSLRCEKEGAEREERREALKGMGREDLLEASVDDLLLDFNNVRFHTCMRDDGIQTIRELIRHSEAELLRFPNFGPKTLNALIATLGSLGLELGDQTYFIDSEWQNMTLGGEHAAHANQRECDVCRALYYPPRATVPTFFPLLSHRARFLAIRRSSCWTSNHGPAARLELGSVG